MKAMRKTIRLGTHGEQYGNWMPVSMLSLMGGLLALAAALAALEGASEETADGAVEEVPQQMQTHQDGAAIFTAMFELALWKLVRV